MQPTRYLAEAGYLEVANVPSKKKAESSGNSKAEENSGASQDSRAEELDPGVMMKKQRIFFGHASGLKRDEIKAPKA